MAPRTYRGLDVHSNFVGTFPWRSRTVEVGPGIKQAYVDEGPRAAPVTFLLCHGNLTWGYLYRRFIKRLSPRYRTIAIDHVGFGRSDKPRDPTYYSLERHIANLETLMESTGATRVVPVVQDWGGPIGMGWATRHPNRVAGAVILNTWAFVKDPPMKLPWIFKFLVMRRGGWRRVVERNFFVEGLLARRGTRRRLPEAELQAYRAPFPTPDDRIGVARFPLLIPETAKPQHESWKTMEAIEDALPRLSDQPALICWADGDIAFRGAHRDRWARLFQDLDGPHMVHAKHFLQEDVPEEILGHMERWASRF